MGIAVRGKVIRSGDNVMIKGITPSGIAAKGLVIHRKVLPLTQDFITSFTMGAIRYDEYWAGFSFRVGSNPLIVTALGRWIVAGNTQSHLINLLNPSGNLLGQVNLDTAGKTPGQFSYQQLSSPVTLLAGQMYYMLSLEKGGDAWSNVIYNFTAAPDAQVIGNSYSSATGSGTGVPSQAQGNSLFVPTNFQYYIK